MSDNQKVGQGALFKNDKQGIEKRPDYTGSATILNKAFYISAWLTTSRNGEKYMSLAFKEKTPSAGNNQTDAQAGEQSGGQVTPAAVDDEIPF